MLEVSFFVYFVPLQQRQMTRRGVDDGFFECTTSLTASVLAASHTAASHSLKLLNARPMIAWSAGEAILIANSFKTAPFGRGFAEARIIT